MTIIRMSAATTSSIVAGRRVVTAWKTGMPLMSVPQFPVKNPAR
jgi:hypothetical protein